MKKEDLALFLGMLCGDGHLSIHNKKRVLKRGLETYQDYCTGFCNTNEKIMELFSDLFYNLFKVRGNFYSRDRPNRKRIYEFNCYSNDVFKEISSLGFPIGVKKDVLKIPSIVSNGSNQEKLNFFFGLLITDGCIRKNQTTIFHSGSKLLLEDLSKLIDNLFNIKKDVKSYIQQERYTSYQLNLNKEETRRILSVPPSHNGIAPVLSLWGNLSLPDATFSKLEGKN